MTHSILRHNLSSLSILLGFILLGCEDPSNVGLGIIGEDESQPTRVVLEGADLPSERTAVITGGIRSGTDFAGSSSYLVGVARDPLFGEIDARGYVDFAVPIGGGSDYRNGTVTSVTLHFVSDDYLYGDTTSSALFTVSGMSEAWSAFGTRSDTTLFVADSITSFDFNFDSGEITVPMPESWIEENRSVLVDPSFTDLFDGFELRAATPSAIARFLGVPGFMRVVTTTGSVDYPMSKLLTLLSKDQVPAIPGRSQIQDGYGDNAVIDFDFAVDSIAGSAVSRTVVHVRLDMEMFDTPDPNFARPVPANLSLIGIRENDTRVVLRSAPIATDGSASFISSTASAGEFTLVRSVQLALTGNSQFNRYAIAITETQASIGAALLLNDGAEEGGPRAVLTLVPSPFGS